jgi:hypothetical protein
MLSRVKSPGINLKKVKQYSEEDDIDFGPGAIFHNKKFKLNKPILFDENDWLTVGDGDGYQDYFSRKGRVKNSVKWGQLKLFTTEMQFFNKYWDPRKVPNPVCVYVGAAPGTHIPILSQLFPWFEFHLYDPRDVFDPRLKSNPKVKLFVQFFENNDAEKYAGRDDVFFLSDIRTIDYNKDQFNNEKTERENEAIVIRDMEMQMDWIKAIQPVKAQLKFRLPYTYDWMKDTTFEYFDGDVYKQPWAPQTSTETRLVPNLDVPMRKWNIPMYEKMLFYHNNVIREHAKFVNPLNNLNENIDSELGLTQDYDSVIFTTTIQEYLKHFSGSEDDKAISDEKTILELARVIIDSIGNHDISIVNLRAGAKGDLSRKSEDRMKRRLKDSGDDDE